jgi:DNA-binding GntR family transcriptional regulator
LIRSAIMNGEHAMGERLVEADVAEKYQISRHVAREALQVLEGAGLVRSDPFRGRSVFAPTPNETEGLFLLRVSLEAVAAAVAAYKISGSDGTRLREKACVPPEGFTSLEELLRWDAAIHRFIWKVADEPVLYDQLERVFWPFMMAVPPLEVYAEGSSREAIVQAQIRREREGKSSHRAHAGVVDAICRKDPAEARQEMIAHLISQKEYSMETGGSVLAAALGFVNGETKSGRTLPGSSALPSAACPDFAHPVAPNSEPKGGVNGLNRLFP